MIPHYYVEDHEDGPLRANGLGGPPRTDKQPLLVAAPLSHGSNPNSNAAGRRREDDENLVAYALEASDGHHGYSSPRGDGADNLVAFNWQSGGDFRPNIGPDSPALQKEQTVAIQNGASVRRLMPVECERLQAIPDGWTDLGGTPDSKRYAALGDAVTVNVAHWIATRIAAEIKAPSLRSILSETA